MKQRLSVFKPDMYSLIALIVVFYAEVVEAVYQRSTSVLINRYIMSAVGPVFAFCVMTFLSLLILSHAEERKKTQLCVQIILVFGVALIWISLCNWLQLSTVLLRRSSSWFTLLATAYAIALTFFKKRMEEKK